MDMLKLDDGKEIGIGVWKGTQTGSSGWLDLFIDDGIYCSLYFWASRFTYTELGSHPTRE